MLIRLQLAIAFKIKCEDDLFTTDCLSYNRVFCIISEDGIRFLIIFLSAGRFLVVLNEMLNLKFEIFLVT